ncbi:winged helix DNA-binding domain-containing protein [Streptomyces mobaraensis]|uniref:Winged helix DNA-binding domain-containing protein n=1 Tax=Streptomyces mobaraensis TaxID=35621 RepID=A0A5N5WHH2_STRMB|nr:winged helix DNA-binding domain-containing protein [Streptomyces mobaraensis]KAB7852773.1 winged helix DNA-binding domain-containing protein [Streptomyces mobaraensis]
MSSPRPRFGDDRRRARIGRRHLLVPACRAGSAEEVADAVVALHATDPATVYLSVCARLAKPTADEVDRALYEDVTLVKLLSMRRTLFAVTTEFAPYVGSSTARVIAARERAQLVKHLRENIEEGAPWDEDRLAAAERAALEALAVRGEATTAELNKDVPALRETLLTSPDKPYAARQSVGSRVLRLLAADGHIRRARPRGSWTSSMFPWAAVAPLPEPPVRESKAEVARRWLDSFGPGTETDLKWWTGWSLGDTRKALADAGAVDVELDCGPGRALPGQLEEEAPPAEPWAALLPGLDPTTMGWRQRDWYLSPEHVPALFDRAGNAGPTVWWNGRVVGAWAQRADGEVVWRLLADVGREAVAAVGAEAERLTAWIGDVRVTPRFRAPLERELAK